MKLSEYLLDRIFSLLCMLVAALVLLALLWLIETPAVFILFAEVILLAAYSTALLYDFFRKQSFYNLLQKMTEQIDIKTLLGELMVPPHFLEGQVLVDVLRCCNKYQNDQLACAEQENREYREYLDSWVHEIKTPITSARLIVENEKNPTTLRIDDELRKIDAYVEQVPERSEYVPCPSAWQQNPNQLSCGNGCMRIADHHDLRRVDWRKHSSCHEQNVPICNAL